MGTPDWHRLLAGARSRTPLTHSGVSGAPIERVVLASGQTVVVKRCSPQTDDIVRITRDDGRLMKLWDGGVFDRMPPVIDHAILAVLPDADGWLIVMRDVGSSFVPNDAALTADQVRAVLRAADELHTTFRGRRVEGACPLDDYLRMYMPVPPEVVDGLDEAHDARWREFLPLAAPDIVEFLTRVRADPVSFFSDMFGRCEQTLVHGDLFPPNVGFLDDRVVMIDWSFATMAPAAFEIAFFLMWCDCGWCAQLGCGREFALDEYRALAGARCDTEALAIGLVTAFALSAVGLRRNPEAVDWWTRRVRGELQLLGLA